MTPTAGLVTSEAGGAATFTIVLDSPPTASVTVGLSSSDLTEGTVSPASVTFTTASWSAPATVTVTGVNDPVADGNQAYTVVTAAATSADPAYSGLDAANVAASNTDDEPAQLAWRTGAAPPPTLARFACSGALAVQVQNVSGTPVAARAARSVNLVSSAAAAGAVFFASADCTGAPVTSLPLAASASEVGFSMLVLGTAATVTNVTGADSLGTLSTTPARPVQVTGPQGALAVTTAADPAIEYEECQPLTVTRRDDTGAPWTRGATAVTVAVPDTTLVTLHGSATCADAALASQAVTVAHGSSTATVYARGRGLNNTVTATAVDPSAGFATGSLLLTTLPLVRRGTCPLTGATSSCVVSPPIPANDISRTFLVFQATASQTGAGASNVTCRLTSGAAVTVDCVRFFGAATAVSVTWQTASWGRSFAAGGVSVQHLNGTLPAGSVNPFDVPAALGAPSSSFLLFSSTGGGFTPTNDAEDFATARLLPGAPPSVRLTNSSAAGWRDFVYALQVVELAGARVDRGTVLNEPGRNIPVSGLLPVTVARTFHLHTVRLATSIDTAEICKRRYRGQSVTATSLLLVRGGGGAGPCNDPEAAEAAWERVELPVGATVQSVDVPIGDLSVSASAAVSPVVAERTLLLLSGQGPGGQAAGETRYSGADNLGAAHAMLTLTGTTLTVTRGLSASQSSALFTPFVVEFP